MNRNSKLTERKLARALRPRAEWCVLPAAFLATLLALPVNAAVIIPSDPLASGLRVAPNILFILDDSGSMEWENINNDSISAITGSGSFNDGPDTAGVTSGNENDYTDETGNNKMYDQSYITNTARCGSRRMTWFTTPPANKCRLHNQPGLLLGTTGCISR